MLPNYTESIILKRWSHLKHINSVKCVHVTKCGQRMNSLSQHQWHGVGVSLWTMSVLRSIFIAYTCPVSCFCTSLTSPKANDLEGFEVIFAKTRAPQSPEHAAPSSPLAVGEGEGRGGGGEGRKGRGGEGMGGEGRWNGYWQ